MCIINDTFESIKNIVGHKNFLIVYHIIVGFIFACLGIAFVYRLMPEYVFISLFMWYIHMLWAVGNWK